MVAASRERPTSHRCRSRRHEDRDGIDRRRRHVHEQHEVPTPTDSQEALLEAIVAAIEPLANERVAAIGFGIPSVIDRSSGRSVGSVNIPLQDVVLDDLTQERFGLPAMVENDANAAALAEWKLGAGRGADDLVMLTLGTGVGGGVVIDGALFRGIAELGHVVVVADGPPCQGRCGGRGHLEAVASGNAADRAAEKLWGKVRMRSCSSAGRTKAIRPRSRRSRGSVTCSAPPSAPS